MKASNPRYIRARAGFFGISIFDCMVAFSVLCLGPMFELEFGGVAVVNTLYFVVRIMTRNKISGKEIPAKIKKSKYLYWTRAVK